MVGRFLGPIVSQGGWFQCHVGIVQTYGKKISQLTIGVILVLYRQRLEYTRFAWAGGTFFPVVLMCQFLVLAGNRFWFYILMYLEYNTVVVLC